MAIMLALLPRDYAKCGLLSRLERLLAPPNR
jgi:hypothetical protein